MVLWLSSLLTSSGKSYTSYHNFIIVKKCKLEPNKRRNTLSKVPESPRCTLPMESEYITLPAHQCMTICRELPTRKALLRLVSRIFFWFHYLSMIDWIISHSWSKSPTSFCPLRLGWYHMTQSLNPLIVWLVFLLWPHHESSC